MHAKHVLHYLTVVPDKWNAVTLSIANANHTGLALQGYRGKVIPLSAFIKRLLAVFSSVQFSTSSYVSRQYSLNSII